MFIVSFLFFFPSSSALRGRVQHAERARDNEATIRHQAISVVRSRSARASRKINGRMTGCHNNAASGDVARSAKAGASRGEGIERWRYRAARRGKISMGHADYLTGARGQRADHPASHSRLMPPPPSPLQFLSPFLFSVVTTYAARAGHEASADA